MALARSGRPVSERAKDFEPSEQTIRTWLKLAGLDEGTRSDGRASVEREELQHVQVGCKRVARLMRAAGLVGTSRRRGVKTTRRQKEAEPAADLVKRDFSAARPNELWVANITYIPTKAGFLYLAVVIDAFSRRVVGWSMADHLRSELVLGALEMALSQCRAHGVIHHSDHGCQYTSYAFGARCRAAGVRPSMGTVGDCYDNAMCESFFATLECALLDREHFATKEQARMALFTYIEGWYNTRRRHSALGYNSPVEFERLHQTKLADESC